LCGNILFLFQFACGIEQFSGIAFEVDVGRAKNTRIVFHESQVLGSIKEFSADFLKELSVAYVNILINSVKSETPVVLRFGKRKETG
jgi:hypothetical protein